MRLQVKNIVEGALEPWLSFPATFSPSDLKQVLSPSPRARLWGLMGIVTVVHAKAPCCESLDQCGRG